MLTNRFQRGWFNHQLGLLLFQVDPSFSFAPFKTSQVADGASDAEADEIFVEKCRWTSRDVGSKRGPSQVGGNSNIFGIFTPKIGGKMFTQFDGRIFFKWVGKKVEKTTN